MLDSPAHFNQFWKYFKLSGCYSDSKLHILTSVKADIPCKQTSYVVGDKKIFQ